MKATHRFVRPSPAPWKSTEASLGVTLDPWSPVDEPCGDCLAACCWFLLVETGSIVTVEDLDWLGFHLDYDGLVLWVSPAGNYTAGIITPCRHFAGQDCSCRAFGQAFRPDICRLYEAEACWYRRQLSGGEPGRLRVDGRRWPSLRRRLRLGEGGTVLGMPPHTELSPVRRDYRVPATLEFDLPADTVADPSLRGDFLHFVSNFEGCSVARTPDGWMLLFETVRDAEVAARPVEVQNDRVGGFEPSRVVRVTSDQLWQLGQEYGDDLFRLSPAALRPAIGRTLSDHQSGS